MPCSSIAVLIVSYNVRESLRRALQSVADATCVIVVDNASADGSAQMVAADFPHVQLLALTENVGFSRAVNMAAARTQAPLLLLLNPDAALPPGGLAVMQAQMARWQLRDPRVWAMGFRQIDECGQTQLAVGAQPSFFNELRRFLLQRQLDARGSSRAACAAWWVDARMPKTREVAWVAGSSMLIRRHAFVQVGGFDPGFFLFFEDIDFCLRLRHAGGRVLFCPELTVVHSRGLSAKGAPGLAQRAYRQSQVRFAQRYAGAAASKWVRLWARLRTRQ